MSTEKLEAEIKTRVAPSTKRAFEEIARERHLDVADVVREAYRDFLAKQVALRRQPELPIEKEAA